MSQSIVSCLLVLCLALLTVVKSTSYGCDVSFNSDSKKSSDPRLINAYNDVLGAIVNLTFDDISLITSAEMLYPGALRHPGGQVGNYWNFETARYVDPCQGDNYNVCGYQNRVSKQAEGTFTIEKFTAEGAIGSSSGLTDIDYRNSIVFMINCLTLEDDDLLAQIDAIYDGYIASGNIELNDNDNVYLELGNEYYWSAYSWYFEQDSTKYMEKVIPLINKAKSKFKKQNLQIAAVTQRQLPTNTHNSNTWNADLTAYTKYFDSVTIHDYSLDTKAIDRAGLSTLNDKISYISAYGQAVIPKYIEFVQNTFGDKKIWFTEYNTKVVDDDIDNEFPFAYSVLHGMFSLNYISTAICNSDDVEFLMMHIMSSQETTGWGKGMYATNYPNDGDTLEKATFNAVGQLLAHVSYIAMVSNNKQYCLDLEDYSGSCPSYTLTIQENLDSYGDVNCIHGTGFNNDGDVNSFGFYIVNNCDMSIKVKLELSSMANTRTKTVKLNKYVYTYNQYGDGAKYSDCIKNNEKVWECGPITPSHSSQNIGKNTKTITLTISKFSVILGDADYGSSGFEQEEDDVILSPEHTAAVAVSSVIFGLICCGFIAWCCYKRRRNKGVHSFESGGDTPMDDGNGHDKDGSFPDTQTVKEEEVEQEPEQEEEEEPEIIVEVDVDEQ